MAQDLANTIIRWAEAIKGANSEAVKNFGAEAEGYKLQTKRGSVTVQDASPFADAVCAAFNVTKDELIMRAGSFSLPEVVDLLREQTPDVDAMEIRSRLERDFGSFMKSSPPVVFLVRERKGKRKEDKQRQIDTQQASAKLMEEVKKSQSQAED